jgi:hypothetical protein
VVLGTLSFPEVSVGEFSESTIEVSNVAGPGAESLVVWGFELSQQYSAQWFSVVSNGEENGSADPGPVGFPFSTPLVLAPSQQQSLAVRFRPLKAGPGAADLRLLSNDPDQPELTVWLVGHGLPAPECVLAVPDPLQFGGIKVGTSTLKPVEIGGCGWEGAAVTGIAMAKGSSPEFQLDLSSLSHVPSLHYPILLESGEKVGLSVTYTPTDVSPLEPNGDVIPDMGAIVVKTLGSDEDTTVNVWGAGVDSDCPSAIIESGDGAVVVSPTLLHLFGSGSFAPSGPVSQWEWTLEQPEASPSALVPSVVWPDPVLDAFLPGPYTLRLSVWDAVGTRSCFPAKHEVLVEAGGGLHLLLTWHTPGDPDETDTGPEAGSDLDLHFLHPNAAGKDRDGDGQPDGWFDGPYDAFWANPRPNWGSFDPATNDDPEITRDDTDGFGPEILNLASPETVVYRFGVHYWNDHGYGPAYATVRVYLDLVLVKEVVDVQLVDADMWDVGSIEWPAGKVAVGTDEEGDYRIAHDYETPYHQGAR